MWEWKGPTLLFVVVFPLIFCPPCARESGGGGCGGLFVGMEWQDACARVMPCRIQWTCHRLRQTSSLCGTTGWTEDNLQTGGHRHVQQIHLISSTRLSKIIPLASLQHPGQHRGWRKNGATAATANCASNAWFYASCWFSPIVWTGTTVSFSLRSSQPYFNECHIGFFLTSPFEWAKHSNRQKNVITFRPFKNHSRWKAKTIWHKTFVNNKIGDHLIRLYRC